MDPWVITPVERARHAEQFATLGPVAGFINGGQAKGFFMQSGLAPMMLAQIWGLADVNGDGQMDLNEFSIACKLITLKLKGFELPSVLPPSILGAFSAMGAMPVASMGMPVASMGMPVASMPLAMPGAMPGMAMQMMPTVPTMTTGTLHMAPMVSVPAAPQMMPMVMPAQPRPTQMMLPNHGQPVMGMVQQPQLEWAIPPATKGKYTNLFHQSDKGRVGFLAGAQARNVLFQSGLPQNILAQIWALSDCDGDGRLGMEEFILSGHLCELALKGEPLPAALPPSLVPPSMRKVPDGVSTPSSTTAESVGSPSTFEDKRKENFNKGQAELERRRQSLIDQQKREEEERKRKEQEEAEAREKLRQEQERQRLAEWEKQRKDELIAHRQREQDNLLQLKAKQQSLNAELETLKEKLTTLTDKIVESRTGVADVKAFIDGMRASRDSKLQEMTDTKNKLKEQNQRLIDVTQEKAILEAKTKSNASLVSRGEAPEMSEYEAKKIEKEKEVALLKEQLEACKERENEKRLAYENTKDELTTYRKRLEEVIGNCKTIYSEFDDKRREMKAEKAKRIRELTDPSYAWQSEERDEVPEMAGPVGGGAVGGAGQYQALYDYEAQNADELSFKEGDIINSCPDQVGEPGWLAGEMHGKTGWFPEAYVAAYDGGAAFVDGSHVEAAQPVHEEAAAVAAKPAPHARVLFDWADSEAAFEMAKGDVMAVESPVSQDWWYGTKVGSDAPAAFFPAAYVLLDSEAPRGDTPEEAPPVPSDKPKFEELGEMFTALYTYASQEPTDVTFEAGDRIYVIKKDGEWWTGRVWDRVGMFPYNYVSTEAAPAAAEPAAAATGEGESAAAALNDSTVGAAQEEPKEAGGLTTRTKSKKKKKDDEGKSPKKMEIAKVVAPYTANGKEQLSLAQGQMIIVRKKTETGWWQGEVQGDKGKKRQVGWFPASYVKLLEASHEKKAAEDVVGEEEAKPEAAAGSGGDTSKYRAAYAFAGQQEDELTFEAGDIITLVSRDEADWWRGEIDGRVGVFPANYVEPIVD